MSEQVPTTTPAAAPSAPAATVPAPADKPAGLVNMDRAFFESKLKAFRSATAAPEAAPEAPAASEPAAAPAPAAETPAPAPAAPAAAEPPPARSAADELPKFMERLAGAESERDTLNKRVSELAPKAEQADKLLQAVKADPIKFLLDQGLTREAVQDFLLNGPKQVDPALAAAQAKADEAAAKVAAFERAQAEQAAAANVAAFKQREVAPHLDESKFPLLHAVNGKDAVEAVYNLMNAAHQRGESLSAAQAAATIEGNLTGIWERLAAAKKPAPAPVATPVAAAPAAPATRQQRPQLTNAPAGSEAEPYAMPDMEARQQRAIEMMKRIRESRA